jgi:hypothetical protein
MQKSKAKKSSEDGGGGGNEKHKTHDVVETASHVSDNHVIDCCGSVQLNDNVMHSAKLKYFNRPHGIAMSQHDAALISCSLPFRCWRS